MHKDAPIGVLFVCLGNICRSPIAEGVFIHEAHERGVLDRFDIDSCGTGGWHAGERADPRARATANSRGVELPSIARKLDPRKDFARFHLILPMDQQNMDDLLRLGAPAERVRLMRSFDATAEHPAEVPDPYYGGAEGFENVFDMVRRACRGLLNQLFVP